MEYHYICYHQWRRIHLGDDWNVSLELSNNFSINPETEITQRPLLSFVCSLVLPLEQVSNYGLVVPILLSWDCS